MKEPSTLTFDEFADELLVETQPRALIILASSQIDHLLKGVLESYLLPKSAKSKDQDELLEGDSPLGTFSARIKMVRRLGLIDENFYDLLNKLRIIRNGAAHWRIFGVADAPLRESIKDLKTRVEERTSLKLILTKYFNATSLRDLEAHDALIAALLTISALAASIDNAGLEFAVGNRKQVKLD